jgi:quercetin dioxygenase-like cupin family protein
MLSIGKRMQRMKLRLLWAALSATAALVAFVVIGPASASPPSGATTTLISRATFNGGYDVNVDGIKVKVKGPVDVATIEVDFQPGGTTGWHSHPGATFVQVKSGTVTRVNADGCLSDSFNAGQGFFEQPNAVHEAVDNSSAPAVTIVTFIVPVGAPLRIDQPPPPNCTP